MSLGERLHAARRAAGFRSQLALARRLGVSRETVSRIERGISRSYGPTLVAWAAACGVSLDELVGTPDTVATNGANASPEDEAAE